MATYFEKQVRDALHAAADDVEEITADEPTDLINLMVATTLHYLTGESETIAEVIERNWEGNARLVDDHLTID